MKWTDTRAPTRLDAVLPSQSPLCSGEGHEPNYPAMAMGAVIFKRKCFAVVIHIYQVPTKHQAPAYVPVMNLHLIRMVHSTRGKKDSEKFSWFPMTIWISHRAWVEIHLHVCSFHHLPSLPTMSPRLCWGVLLGWTEGGTQVKSTGVFGNGEW